MYIIHNCFEPPSLLVEGMLSTVPTPSSFYILVEIWITITFFQHTTQFQIKGGRLVRKRGIFDVHKMWIICRFFVLTLLLEKGVHHQNSEFDLLSIGKVASELQLLLGFFSFKYKINFWGMVNLTV